MTRRTLFGSLALPALGQAQQRRVEWKPRLGILGRFTPANVEFARAQGFNNMILDGLAADKLTDSQSSL